jgi:hypothetical protein
MKLFITHIFYIGLWVCVAVGQSNNRNTDEWYKEVINILLFEFN